MNVRRFAALNSDIELRNATEIMLHRLRRIGNTIALIIPLTHLQSAKIYVREKRRYN